MKESKIEKYLREQIHAIGGIAYKFSSPMRAAVPDRIILMPRGLTYFVELKATGEKPTPLQIIEHDRIKKLHHQVIVIDSINAVNDFVNRLTETQERLKCQYLPR